MVVVNAMNSFSSHKGKKFTWVNHNNRIQSFIVCHRKVFFNYTNLIHLSTCFLFLFRCWLHGSTYCILCWLLLQRNYCLGSPILHRLLHHHPPVELLWPGMEVGLMYHYWCEIEGLLLLHISSLFHYLYYYLCSITAFSN